MLQPAKPIPSGASVSLSIIIIQWLNTHDCIRFESLRCRFKISFYLLFLLHRRMILWIMNGILFAVRCSRKNSKSCRLVKGVPICMSLMRRTAVTCRGGFVRSGSKENPYLFVSLHLLFQNKDWRFKYYFCQHSHHLSLYKQRSTRWKKNISKLLQTGSLLLPIYSCSGPLLPNQDRANQQAPRRDLTTYYRDSTFSSG